ncbi:YbjN domain-containing protein [Spongisporangium articulatum]|uniref:YbjN domain-containing protein n=1 Tax=Spongisporangium articulatum TaxID=3362603 RepID=A0ABW8AJS7_9ACTN
MSGLKEAASAALTAWVEQSDVPSEPGERRGEVVVVLPGERKLKTVVSVLVGDRGLSASTFLIRKPEENETEFFRWMLNRNAKLPGIAFSLDALGDVYLVGRVPLAGVTVDTVDDLLGALLATSDDSFNELLALGFLSSMKKEWAWRVERGESTKNLEAFRHLLETTE